MRGLRENLIINTQPITSTSAELARRLVKNSSAAIGLTTIAGILAGCTIAESTQATTTPTVAPDTIIEGFSTPTPEQTQQPTPELTATPTQEATPQPPSLEGFPGVPVPEQALITSAIEPYARAMGIEPNSVQLQYQQLTDVNGQPFMVATHRLDPNPEQQGEPLEGDYPLLIATQDENGEWGWKRATLKEFAGRLGMNIGTELTGWWFGDGRWREIVGREFNIATIDWGVYWTESEPTQGNFDFTVIDRQLALAEQTDMKVRGHALVFPSVSPDWIRSGNFTRDQLITILNNHISTLVSHYRGRIDEWVVVNEPYIYPYRTNDVFYRIIGPDYIDIAFRAAREADPSARLIYEDTFNHTPDGITTQLTREVVTRLQEQGLIDAVGLQMHIDGASPPTKEEVII